MVFSIGVRYKSLSSASVANPFFAITPRSTRIQGGNTCEGPIYETNRSICIG